MIKIKRMDFVILTFIIIAVVLFMDNLYFQDSGFVLSDLHHEAYILALLFGSLLLILVRKRLL